jgi:biotin operon repressor
MKKINPYVKFEMYELDQRITHAELSAKAQLVYFRLGLLLKDINSNRTIASLGELVKKTNMSRITVIKAVKELKEKGFISTDSQNGRACKYELLTGIYNGKKELLNEDEGIEKPSKKSYQVPSKKSYQVFNGSLYIYKQKKKEQLQHEPEKPKQKPKRASSSSFSKSKINLAKQYFFKI